MKITDQTAIESTIDDLLVEVFTLNEFPGRVYMVVTPDNHAEASKRLDALAKTDVNMTGLVLRKDS